MGVEGSGLEARGPLLGLVRREGLDARASLGPGADIDALPDGKAARALRAHEALVAGEADHVQAHGGHVDRDAAGGLGGVHHQQGSGLVGYRGNAPKVSHVARDV